MKLILAYQLDKQRKLKLKGVSIMKKNIQLIAVLMIISIASFANPFFSSALEIKVAEVGFYSFEINGQTYANTSRGLVLGNLAPGNYNVRIYKSHNYGKYNRRPQNILVYEDYIFVPQYTSVQGRLDRFGMKYHQSEIRMHHQDPRNQYRPQPICEPNGNHHIYENRIVIMNNAAHQDLIRALEHASFDNTKMSIAKAAVANNRMNVHQIALIMRTFSFDSYRLEIAKFAYESCVDQHNYYNLSNEFTFDSNARALMNSII